MKKLILIAGIFLVFSFVSKGQYTPADVFKVDNITWYGLDFSNIKLIGSEGFTDPYAIKNQFFYSWNNLIITETDKYDLAGFFHKSSVENDLSIVEGRNMLPDPDELVINTNYSLGEDEVKKIISEYDITGKEGIGLVFIMESFNKNKELGYMWVTFFDLETKEVLLSNKMSGKPGGFGIRNYWAKSFYNVMKSIEKKKWKAWKAQY
ncbi:MAG: hypothetical protein K8R63_04760 [Bacteroidales bacterium]|nr:hypothetical protein [Bacteroidales bacterium]